MKDMSNKQSGCTSEKLIDCINDAFTKGTFPDCLIPASITPVFKKGKLIERGNVRPSLLPLLSEVFKQLIYYQLKKYMDEFRNSLLCGFLKARLKQLALFQLLQS